VLSDTILAERFAPAHLIRRGVRCIKLRNTQFVNITNAFILAEVTVTGKGGAPVPQAPRKDDSDAL
jgi:hypothetical protein